MWGGRQKRGRGGAEEEKKKVRTGAARVAWDNPEGAGTLKS